ncbi:MAG TPA: hypothetical protein VHM64_01870 [Candidatus Binatia bacterium]|nr:hypothetical protein [Candidatus Binatia bacterium]
MQRTALSLIAVLLTLGVSAAAFAADMRDNVKVEVQSIGLHPGMDPGMYVCASDHLHIKGTVHNLAKVTLGKIKVAGKAFGADDKLLGEATFSPPQAILKPGEKAEINLEFLTITGPLIQKVKRHELIVVEAPARK